MRAIHLDTTGTLAGDPSGRPKTRLRVRDDVTRPEPAADEVLVRVDRAGICGTDLELMQGYKGGFRGILGHEFVGTVIEGGAPERLGKRVTATINVGCQVCPECRRSGPEHCPERQVLGILGRDGVFAEYVAVPERNLLAVPDVVPDEHAVFVEPLAAALRIREQVAVHESHAAAVVGPGRLGMLVARVLALAGTRVTVVGRRPESLAVARLWQLGSCLVGELDAASCHLVVEATGAQAGFAEALRLARPRGVVVQKSTFAGAAEFDLSRLVVDEISVVGSRCGPFAPALRLLAEGAIDATALIDAEYPLGEGLAALRHAARPGVRKVLLAPRA